MRYKLFWRDDGNGIYRSNMKPQKSLSHELSQRKAGLIQRKGLLEKRYTTISLCKSDYLIIDDVPDSSVDVKRGVLRQYLNELSPLFQYAPVALQTGD